MTRGTLIHNGPMQDASTAYENPDLLRKGKGQQSEDS